MSKKPGKNSCSFTHNKIRATLIQDFVEANIHTATKFCKGQRDHPALISSTKL